MEIRSHFPVKNNAADILLKVFLIIAAKCKTVFHTG